MNIRTTRQFRTAPSLAGLAFGLLIPFGIAVAQNGSAAGSDFQSDSRSGQLVFPPNSHPFDKSFPEWSAEWWQLTFSLPTSDNPVNGQDCSLGQRGKVWFLAGSFESSPFSRSCSVPEGKALFFPVINRIDINVTDQTVRDLRAEIAPCLNAATNLSAEVDGEYIDNLERFRVKSVPFEVAVPPNGLFGLEGIYSPVVGDGFYLMLKPLHIGTHIIHVSAQEPVVGTCGSATVDGTYTVTVKPVKIDRGR